MTVGNAKTRGIKPSMVSMACPFFRASASESIGDSIIFGCHAIISLH